MKNKRKIKVLLLAGCLVLTFFCGGTSRAAGHSNTDADGNLYAYTITEEQTGESDCVEDYDFQFSEQTEKDGVRYTLNHVEYFVCSEYEEQYGDKDIADKIIKTEDGISAEAKETYIPSKTIAQDGFRYQYKNTDFKKSSDSKDPIEIETYMDTDFTTAELSSLEIPDTVAFSYEGKPYTLNYDHSEKLNDGWKSGYTITGTIHHYDASTIRLGGITIEPEQLADVSLSEMQTFAAQFGYTPEVYRLQSVSYSGDAYTDANGVVCRDYKIVTDVYMRQFRHYYTYSEDRSIYTAENTYELSKSDIDEIEELKNTYKVSATAFYDEVKETTKKTLSLPAKIAITFGVIVGIVLIAALILYLVKGGRKGTDYRSKRDSKRDYRNL